MSYEKILQAARTQDLHALQEILKSCHIDVCQPGKIGWTALAQTIFDNDLEAQAFLESNGASVTSATWSLFLGKKDIPLLVQKGLALGINPKHVLVSAIKSGYACLEYAKCFGLMSSENMEAIIHAYALSLNEYSFYKDVIDNFFKNFIKQYYHSDFYWIAAQGAAESGNFESAHRFLTSANGPHAIELIRYAARGGHWDFIESFPKDLIDATKLAIGAVEGGFLEKALEIIQQHRVDNTPIIKAAELNGYFGFARDIQAKVAIDIDEVTSQPEKMDLPALTHLQSLRVSPTDLAQQFVLKYSTATKQKQKQYKDAITVCVQGGANKQLILRQLAMLCGSQLPTSLKNLFFQKDQSDKEYIKEMLVGLLKGGHYEDAKAYFERVKKKSDMACGTELILAAISARCLEFAREQIGHYRIHCNRARIAMKALIADDLDIIFPDINEILQQYTHWVSELSELAAAIYLEAPTYWDKSYKTLSSFYSKENTYSFDISVASILIREGMLSSARNLLGLSEQRLITHTTDDDIKESYLLKIIEHGHYLHALGLMKHCSWQRMPIFCILSNVEDKIEKKHAAMVFKTFLENMIFKNTEIFLDKINRDEQYIDDPSIRASSLTFLANALIHRAKFKNLKRLIELGADSRFIVFLLAQKTNLPFIKTTFELLDKDSSDINWAIAGFASAGNTRAVTACLKKGGDILWAIMGASHADNTSYLFELSDIADRTGIRSAMVEKFIAMGVGLGSNISRINEFLTRQPSSFNDVFWGACVAMLVLRNDKNSEFYEHLIRLSKEHPKNTDLMSEIIKLSPKLAVSLFQKEADFSTVLKREYGYYFLLQERKVGMPNFARFIYENHAVHEMVRLALKAALLLESHNHHHRIEQLLDHLNDSQKKDFLLFFINHILSRTGKERNGLITYLSKYSPEILSHLHSSKTFLLKDQLMALSSFRRNYHLSEPATLLVMYEQFPVIKMLLQGTTAFDFLGKDISGLILSYLVVDGISGNDISKLQYMCFKEGSIQILQGLLDKLKLAQTEEDIEELTNQVEKIKNNLTSYVATGTQSVKRPRVIEHEVKEESVAKRLKDSKSESIMDLPKPKDEELDGQSLSLKRPRVIELEAQQESVAKRLKDSKSESIMDLPKPIDDEFDGRISTELHRNILLRLNEVYANPNPLTLAQQTLTLKKEFTRWRSSCDESVFTIVQGLGRHNRISEANILIQSLPKSYFKTIGSSGVLKLKTSLIQGLIEGGHINEAINSLPKKDDSPLNSFDRTSYQMAYFESVTKGILTAIRCGRRDWVESLLVLKEENFPLIIPKSGQFDEGEKMAIAAIESGYIDKFEPLFKKFPDYRNRNNIKLAVVAYSQESAFFHQLRQQAKDAWLFDFRVALDFIEQNNIVAAFKIMGLTDISHSSTVPNPYCTEFLIFMMRKGYVPGVVKILENEERDFHLNHKKIIEAAILNEKAVYPEVARLLRAYHERTSSAIMQIKAGKFSSVSLIGADVTEMALAVASHGQLKDLDGLIKRGADVNQIVRCLAEGNRDDQIAMVLRLLDNQKASVNWAIAGFAFSANQPLVAHCLENGAHISWALRGALKAGNLAYSLELRKHLQSSSSDLSYYIGVGESGVLADDDHSTETLNDIVFGAAVNSKKDLILSLISLYPEQKDRIIQSTILANPILGRSLFPEHRKTFFEMDYLVALAARGEVLNTAYADSYYKQWDQAMIIKLLSSLEKNAYYHALSQIFSSAKLNLSSWNLERLELAAIDMLTTAFKRHNIDSENKFLLYFVQFTPDAADYLMSVTTRKIMFVQKLNTKMISEVSHLIHDDNLSLSAALNKVSKGDGASSCPSLLTTDKRLQFIARREQALANLEKYIQALKGIKIKSVNANPAFTESSFSSFEKSYIAKTAAGGTCHFSEIKIDGSQGNCGFNALNTTRTEVVAILLQLILEPQHRETLSSEIQTALVPGSFGRSDWTLSNPKHLEEWKSIKADEIEAGVSLDEYKRLCCDQFPEWDSSIRQAHASQQEQITSLISFLEDQGEYEYSKRLFQLFQRTEDICKRMQDFCSRQDIAHAYVMAFQDRQEGGQHLWLGYKAAVLFAKYQKINLTIWIPTGEGPNIMVQESITHEQPTGVINMLHTGFNHFNVLVEKPKPQLYNYLSFFKGGSSPEEAPVSMVLKP